MPSPPCPQCNDTLVVPGRGGAPHECPRCAMILHLGTTYAGRGRNFDGKWWAAYEDTPELQEKVMIEFGARLRFTGEAILKGFMREEPPKVDDETTRILADQAGTPWRGNPDE